MTTVLVDALWLWQLAEEGGVLPRLQDLPPGARVTLADLEKWPKDIAGGDNDYTVGALIISYPWLDRNQCVHALPTLAPRLQRPLPLQTTDHIFPHSTPTLAALTRTASSSRSWPLSSRPLPLRRASTRAAASACFGSARHRPTSNRPTAHTRAHPLNDPLGGLTCQRLRLSPAQLCFASAKKLGRR